MLPFKQFFLLETTDAEIANIKQWRQQFGRVLDNIRWVSLLSGEAEEYTDITDKEKQIAYSLLDPEFKRLVDNGKVDRFGVVANNQSLFEIYSTYMLEMMGKVKNSAFAKYRKFHELEYKLYLLESTYDKNDENVQRLIDFTKYELLKLYDWLKPFIETVLDTRVRFIYFHYGLTEDSFIKSNLNDTGKQAKDANNPGWGESYTSIFFAFALLNNAVTLSDKIKATTLALNAAHDQSSLFTSEGWFLSPFTIQQYESLSHVNTKKIDADIKKELGY